VRGPGQRRERDRLLPAGAVANELDGHARLLRDPVEVPPKGRGERRRTVPVDPVLQPRVERGPSGQLIVDRLGLGEVVGSWVSTGKNLPVSPDQLQQVMGSGKIQEIAQSLGLHGIHHTGFETTRQALQDLGLEEK
jgi:hypothetical protein